MFKKAILKKKEKGVALIFALILMVVLSVMAVSLMFVAQTETWSSLNYRTMTQARYGAESGISAAANYLTSTAYKNVAPGTATDPLTNYNTAATTDGYVQRTSGGDVVLSANSSQSSNYPLDAVRTAFVNAAAGNVTAGNNTVNYRPWAKLKSVKTIQSYATGSQTALLTWEITSDGNIPGVKSGQVEVSATLEQLAVPTFAYDAFADANGCAALSFGGCGTTNSYDSSTVANAGTNSASVSFQNYGGNVGTNGNLTEKGGSTVIYGSLSTPRSGVGSCSSSNVTALTLSGSVQPTQGLVELPQNINYDTPLAPSPVPPTTSMTVSNNSPSCASFPAGSCTTLPAKNPTDLYITAGSTPATATLLGNVTVKGNLHFTPPAGTAPGSPVYININSLTTNGTPTITIDPIPGTNPPQYADLVLNFAGSGTATVIDMTGGSLVNNSLDPATFQLVYAGTGQITVNGNSKAAGLVYAPNASVKFAGGSDWYGAVIANNITDFGGAAIHYDRRLQKEMFMPGNFVLSAFDWKKF